MWFTSRNFHIALKVTALVWLRRQREDSECAYNHTFQLDEHTPGTCVTVMEDHGQEKIKYTVPLPIRDLCEKIN